MPQFTAISRDSHAGKKWQRFKSYGFASKVVLAPVVGVELAQAVLALPLAFLQEADRFVLVAVLSLKPGRNMLVGPDGRWLGSYVPAYLRAYPFRLLPHQGTGQTVLCIDTDSGLVVEGDAAGEDFVGPDGNISPALKKVLDFLNELQRSRQATDVAVSALAEAGVIQPWPIKLKTEHGDQPSTGLHRVDEAAFNALTDDAFLKLRKASAFPINLRANVIYGPAWHVSSILRGCRRSCDHHLLRLCRKVDSLFELPADDIVRFR